MIRRRTPKERGSVVTWAVVGLMLVSLLFYLAVAFFAEDPADSPQNAPENAPEMEASPPAAARNG